MFLILHLLQFSFICDIVHIIRLGSGIGIQCGEFFSQTVMYRAPLTGGPQVA